MDDQYDRLDPQERYYKILSLTSVLFGSVSICVGLIPFLGIIGSVIGIIAGFYGRRSENHKLANLGIFVSSFALTLSLTYGFFAYLVTPK